MDQERFEKDGGQEENPFDEMTAVRTPREALRRLHSLLRGVLDFNVSLLSFWSGAEGEAYLYVVGADSVDDSPTLRRLPASSPPEFRLIDGNLVALSHLDERHSSTQITTLFSNQERSLQSGLTVPIQTRDNGRVSLVLASYTESLVGRRAVFDDPGLKTQLAQVLEGIASHGVFSHRHEGRGFSYQEVFQRFATPAAIVSADGTVHLMNDALEALCGLGTAEVSRGLTLFEVIHPKDGHRLARFLAASDKDEASWPASAGIECTLIKRDGSERVVMLHSSRLRAGDRLVVAFHDVTRYKQSETDLRDWVDRIEAINKITAAVNSSLDFEGLFATVCDHIRDMIDYDIASLVLRSEVDSEGCLRAAVCGASQPQRVDVSPARFAEFLQRHGDTIIESWEGEDEKLLRSLLGERVRSFRILPLLLNQEPEGCLCVGSYYPQAFSSYHTAVLRGIAAQLAIAVHKSRMYREMQRHLSNLNHLAQNSTALTATLDLDRISSQVVQAAEQILAPRIVWVESLKRGELVPVATAGQVDAAALLKAIQPTAGIRRILRSQRPVHIERLRSDRTLPAPRKKALLEAGVQRLTAIAIKRLAPGPMLLWIGREAGRAFTEFEEELLLTLASHAAAAIAKAYLYSEVRETKNYLQNVIESSIDAIVTVDRAGRITFVGKGGQETFGYKEQDVVGKPAWQFYVGGRAEAARLWQMLIKKKGKLSDHPIEIFRSDGTAVPVSLSVSKIRNHKGRTVGYLGIAKDMTEQRRAEREIRRKSEELENFVYLISHNLKAPIVSVQGFASLLMSEGDELDDAQRQRYLDRILKNVAHMQEMIHDLLEFSRIGRVERKEERVNLQELLESLVEEMRLQFMEKRIAVRLPADLPIVTGDRDGLQAIFSNLLSNAVKYIGNPEEPKIEVGWEDKGRFFVFWVRDNGIGIEPKYQEKVFDLFHRGGQGHEVEGTGVGLAIVKRIVENHGGAVQIVSERGVGTTVSFTLPQKEGRQKTKTRAGR